jgi:hypothetical protein
MKMLKKFHLDFLNYHEFEGKELDNLKNQYKDIKFQDIPVSWVPILEKMLKSFKNPENRYSTIKQKLGRLIVMARLIPNAFDKNYLKLTKLARYEIIEKDKKLYKEYNLTVLDNQYNEMGKIGHKKEFPANITDINAYIIQMEEEWLNRTEEEDIIKDIIE